MAKINIDRERCKGCLFCISFCPKGLIGIDKRLNRRGVEPVKFKEQGECLGCAMCAIICPDCCIEVYKNSQKFNV
ncbi:MAG: 4Fe-4S dicluster domain-containing protein [Candidatus Omnitrophica bacterium]|nr:4Fe-4S dicluster domain-containing protein [Candidatus Omnitrophota bacterium]MBU4346665.1 4Fe-4S dicluster domain-containing protein [Candidatus Omnitrophota bacterium]MBU4473003.1 4Fe-4S dicluster domain-containing protein [Candidatus Omnitrophota bacterium]MCG2706819.1 4Fe-4S dicluster domain-containing protein [Candidatus Omnitrophota bacterium]